MTDTNTKETRIPRDENGLTEDEYLSQYNSDAFPKPSLTADILIFRRTGDDIHLLMIRRRNHPYIGCLALPGGFAEPGETIETSAARELEEETNLTRQELIGQEMKLVGVYSKPGRDPRGWTVSAAFATLVDGDKLTPRAGDDAASIHWVPLKRINDGTYSLAANDRIAFDHIEIIRDAIKMIFE